MRTSDFDYVLPEELIAQTPLLNRSDSRMLLVDRNSFSLEHDHFYNLGDHLHSGDTLVFNDTKVMPARLIGTKIDTGAAIEILLLEQLENDVWEVLAKPARRIRRGTVIVFGEGLLLGKCVGEGEEGIRHLRMIYKGVFLELLDILGEMPLPPYITEKLDDKERYQTVYSRVIGSAAAPTAGFHFTPDLIGRLKQNGIETVFLTLHVGLGTFRPVQTEDLTSHPMHSERYEISSLAAETLNQAKSEKRRIISVGTTSTRVLETNMNKHGKFQADAGITDIFIYPGYTFRAIDALITNFHLPRSTLLMLVSAFATKEIILNAYKEAIKEKYRFFSFGDSMFIRKM